MLLLLPFTYYKIWSRSKENMTKTSLHWYANKRQACGGNLLWIIFLKWPKSGRLRRFRLLVSYVVVACFYILKNLKQIKGKHDKNKLALGMLTKGKLVEEAEEQLRSSLIFWKLLMSRRKASKKIAFFVCVCGEIFFL